LALKILHTSLSFHAEKQSSVQVKILTFIFLKIANRKAFVSLPIIKINIHFPKKHGLLKLNGMNRLAYPMFSYIKSIGIVCQKLCFWMLKAWLLEGKKVVFAMKLLHSIAKICITAYP